MTLTTSMDKASSTEKHYKPAPFLINGTEIVNQYYQSKLHGMLEKLYTMTKSDLFVRCKDSSKFKLVIHYINR